MPGCKAWTGSHGWRCDAGGETSEGLSGMGQVGGGKKRNGCSGGVFRLHQTWRLGMCGVRGKEDRGWSLAWVLCDVMF